MHNGSMHDILTAGPQWRKGPSLGILIVTVGPHKKGANPNQKFRKLVSYHNVKTIGRQCISFSYPANRNSEVQCEVKKKILIGPDIQT